jgi:hypothetical protein
MLNANAIKLKQYLDTNVQDNDLKKKLLSLATGIAVARMVSLPTSQVERALEYFNQQALQQVNEKIYTLNEQVIVDTEYCFSVAKSYWLIRYNTAYPNFDLNVVTTTEYDLYCKLAGVDIYLSLDDYKLSNENKTVVLNLLNLVYTVLK